MLESAYIDNLSLYPYATFNGANLWYLSAGKITPTRMHPLGQEQVSQFPELLLTPWFLGFALFVALTLMVAGWGWRSHRLPHSERQACACRLATLAGLGFFALAAGMRDRYLFLALPLAAFWATEERQALVWFLALTLMNLVNTALILHPRGDFLWQLTVCAVIAALAVLLLRQSVGSPSPVGSGLNSSI